MGGPQYGPPPFCNPCNTYPRKGTLHLGNPKPYKIRGLEISAKVIECLFASSEGVINTWRLRHFPPRPSASVLPLVFERKTRGLQRLTRSYMAWDCAFLPCNPSSKATGMYKGPLAYGPPYYIFGWLSKLWSLFGYPKY